ncbi:DUF5994 family protein [Streptomyces sp. NPDC050564]|uniref:DUF5994 family protein n=1 Tax=Streptomyces sp. NPDC050564 TaxID=3365631 RepID=UPI00378B6351
MTTALQPGLPSHPLLRLRLAPRGGMPCPVDGAWWPRSSDLLPELPRLLAGLPRAGPHHLRHGQRGDVVRGARPDARLQPGRTAAPGPHGIRRAHHRPALARPGGAGMICGAVPPDTAEEAAEPLMAAAVDGQA